MKLDKLFRFALAIKQHNNIFNNMLLHIHAEIHFCIYSCPFIRKHVDILSS